MSMYRDAMRQAKKQSRPSGVVQRRKPSVSHDTQIQIRRAKVKQAVNRKYAEAVEEDAGYSTPRTAAEHAAQKSGCPPSWKAKVTSNILFYQKGLHGCSCGLASAMYPCAKKTACGVPIADARVVVTVSQPVCRFFLPYCCSFPPTP